MYPYLFESKIPLGANAKLPCHGDEGKLPFRNQEKKNLQHKEKRENVKREHGSAGGPTMSRDYQPKECALKHSGEDVKLTLNMDGGML